MRINDLFEAPIADIGLVGDFNKAHSFRQEQDRKLLSNPKAIQKIQAKWDKTPVDFNMYFVNMPGMAAHHETGEVTRQWMETNMAKVLPHIQLSEDAINIIFTNNRGDERVPMTAWIIAHRLGHALEATSRRQRGSMTQFTDAYDVVMRTAADILQNAYGTRQVYASQEEITKARFYRNDIQGTANYQNLLKYFFQAIGTFRSARNGEIRNVLEFILELFAQYMITGTVKFNPLPQNFGHGRSNWGRQEQKYLRRTPENKDEDFNQDLNTLARDLQDYYFPDILSAAIGRIYVM